MAHPQTHVESGLNSFDCLAYGLEGVRENAEDAIRQLREGGAVELADRVERWLEALPDAPVITHDEKEAAILAAAVAA
jgi:hypothetical protein